MANELNQSRLATMAKMQDGYNSAVHPQWREQGYEYYRAIWVECAELLDHFGWKWWKHQQPDLPQVKLEIVDIWHFGLSELMRSGQMTEDFTLSLQPTDDKDASPEELTAQLFRAGSGAELSPTDFRNAVEQLAAQCVAQQSFFLPAFIQVLDTLPMDYNELFSLYVGKNVLNHFRQDHGYKTGDYQKVWQGLEDNEHLMAVLPELSGAPEDAAKQLYELLEQRYPAAK